MNRWEYKLLELSENVGGRPGYEVWAPWKKSELVEKQLNLLGSDGWELVSIVAHPRHDGGTSGVALFFKRLVPKSVRT